MLPLHSPEEEIGYIHGEMRRLDNAIQRLHEERATLLRRLNAVQARTRVFPPETLSLIFQHACTRNHHPNPESFPFEERGGRAQCDEHTSKFFHLRLAAVSSLWRQIVLTTPQLWSHINFESNDDRSLLKLHFDNSGSLPLDLALSEFPDPDTSATLPPITSEDFVRKNFARVRSLHLSASPESWLAFSPYLTGLVELTLSFAHETPSRSIPPTSGIDLVLPSNTHLRRLNLYHGFYNRIELPWTMITVLNLHDIAADVCAQTVVRCPNLTELFFDVKPCRRAGDGSSLSQPVTLHNLRTLGWVYHADPWSWAVLNCLQLPALEALTWLEMYLGPYDESTVTFFKRLPLTLSSLELQDVSVWSSNGPTILDILPSHVNLERLRLVYSDTDFILRVVRKLTPVGGNQEPSTHSFPKLRKLTIKGNRNVSGLDEPLDRPDVSNTMLGMVEARSREYPNTHLRVEFVWLHFVWTLRDRKRFRELLDDGARIEVAERFEGQKHWEIYS